MSIKSLTQKVTKTLSNVAELKDNLTSTKAIALAALAFSLVATPNMAHAQSSSDKIKDVGGAALVVGIFGWLTNNQNSINSATNSVITAVATDAGNQIKGEIDSNSSRTRAAMGKVTREGVTGALKGATDEIGVTSYKKKNTSTGYQSVGGGLNAPELVVAGVGDYKKKIGINAVRSSNQISSIKLRKNYPGTIFSEKEIELYKKMSEDKFNNVFQYYLNRAANETTTNNIADVHLLADMGKTLFGKEYGQYAAQVINGNSVAFNSPSN